MGCLSDHMSVRLWIPRIPHRFSKVEFDHFPSAGILTTVKWLKTVVAMVLLVIWMPATMCCALERAGVSFFDKCCADETSHDTPQPPCTDKSCCLLESGRYTAQITPPVAVVPLDVVALVPWALVDTPQRPQLAFDFSNLAPPDLRVTWQFSCRTALPPRAPSFLS